MNGMIEPVNSTNSYGSLTEREIRAIRMAEKALLDTETLATLLGELIGELRTNVEQAKDEASKDNAK